MTYSRRAVCTLVMAIVIAVGVVGSSRAQSRGEDNPKPNLALRINPPVGFTPLRVRVEVDLKGGADDFQDFYCPSIEWDWADGTVSESGTDCEPYEAGKSKIQRRYTTTYTFRQPGEYKVYFRMKQRSKIVGAASATVQVRPGVRGDFDDR